MWSSLKITFKAAALGRLWKMMISLEIFHVFCITFIVKIHVHWKPAFLFDTKSDSFKPQCFFCRSGAKLDYCMNMYQHLWMWQEDCWHVTNSVMSGHFPPPLFSVLVSRQDLFYLNYNEGKRVSETGLWQIMKWRQKGELNLEHVQKSQANIMCCALHHRWQQTNINNKIKRSCKQQQPTNK